MKKYRCFTVLFLTVCFLNGSAQNIYQTACDGNLERLDSLLQSTDLRATDDRGRSLLHWAVACRQMEVLQFLVDRGAELNPADRDGFSPLYTAVRFNNEVFLDTLIGRQENARWTTQLGTSLLERAILNKNLPIVKKLVGHGVDINRANARESTPLEIAIRIGAEEISAWLRSRGADQSQVRTFAPAGAYLGQAEPGLIPTMFAPNFISTEEHEFGSVFNARGTDFYFGVDVNGKPEIRYTQRREGTWSKPVPVLSDESYSYNDPFLSPDENRLYFISSRSPDGVGDAQDIDIWYVERENNGWSAPINAGPNINTEGNEYYISFTDEGTMYFSSNGHSSDEARTDHDIYYSRFVDGEFQAAVALGDSINTEHYEADVFVAPDESYLIFCSIRPDGRGRGDLYISYKNPDGTWTKSMNMGEPVNTERHELCPFVTQDGKYLLYTSHQDIYWVSTEIFKRARQ